MKPGDLIIVPKDNRIPADLVLLATCTEEGVGFMETSTLDGEKHLKPRYSLKETMSRVAGDFEINKGKVNSFLKLNMDMNVYVPDPTPSLYNFEGFIKFYKGEKESSEKISIGIKNYLFKGAKIRTVDWVIGVVVYTGTDTKIQQNGADARFKVSSVERKMHIMIMILFGIQILMSIIAVIVRALYDNIIDDNFDEFLILQGYEDDYNVFLVFLRYFILLNSLIPISLIVGLELTRMVQAYFMFKSLELKNKERDV